MLKRVLLLVLAIVGALACLLCAVISGAIPLYCTDITDSAIEQVFANMQVAMLQRIDPDDLIDVWS